MNRSFELIFPAPWFSTSGLQNCYKIHLSCYKQPSSWQFVIAVLGNKYTLSMKTLVFVSLAFPPTTVSPAIIIWALHCRCWWFSHYLYLPVPKIFISSTSPQPTTYIVTNWICSTINHQFQLSPQHCFTILPSIKLFQDLSLSRMTISNLLHYLFKSQAPASTFTLFHNRKLHCLLHWEDWSIRKGTFHITLSLCRTFLL